MGKPSGDQQLTGNVDPILTSQSHGLLGHLALSPGLGAPCRASLLLWTKPHMRGNGVTHNGDGQAACCPPYEGFEPFMLCDTFQTLEASRAGFSHKHRDQWGKSTTAFTAIALMILKHISFQRIPTREMATNHRSGNCILTLPKPWFAS